MTVPLTMYPLQVRTVAMLLCSLDLQRLQWTPILSVIVCVHNACTAVNNTAKKNLLVCVNCSCGIAWYFMFYC